MITAFSDPAPYCTTPFAFFLLTAGKQIPFASAPSTGPPLAKQLAEFAENLREMVSAGP